MPIPNLQRSEQDPYKTSRTFEFISPMFGGGVSLSPKGKEHIKLPDPITPVRGASLRGQLRAWWRRVCTEKPSVAKTLTDAVRREREKLLWGWASTDQETNKGLISIHVNASKLTPSQYPVYEEKNPKKPLKGWGAPLAYGAFPLQPAQKATDRRAGTLTQWEGTFHVDISLRVPADTARIKRAWGSPSPAPEMWEEVLKTLSAFSCFGGLGGRTRRGFGAIAACDDEPDFEKVAELLGWSDRIAFTEMSNQEKAHEAALRAIMTFRQGRDVGRNHGGQHPGRSRWPEPDTIRRFAEPHEPHHKYEQRHKPEHPVQAAPRAAFGMPIIVQFKDSQDPDNHTIVPIGGNRLSSPLILRPVRRPEDGKRRSGDGKRRFVAMALRLPLLPGDRRILKGIEIQNSRGRKTIVSGKLTSDDARKVRPLDGEPDVLKSFISRFPALTKE